MNNSRFLLSIIVATLNRVELLKITLPLLLEQVIPFIKQVELLIVNNSSTDDTYTWLENLNHRQPEVKVIHFDNQANIDDSFKRCVEAAHGEYICIFGDDDIPFPNFVTKILAVIKEHNPALIYFNRIIGNEYLSKLTDIAHKTYGINDTLYTTSTFISTFTHWPSFISSLVFKYQCWLAGEPFYQPDFLGYKFLARVYYGASAQQCLYVGLPYLIQRRGIQSWKKDWPRYWLVNLPTLLSLLEQQGHTQGALAVWQQKEVSIKRLLIDLIVAKAYSYPISDSFWKQATAFQKFPRNWLVILVKYVISPSLAKKLYFSSGKYKNEG